MKVQGIPIRELHLPQRINVGISIEANEGFVSEYECREAAIFGHYNWSEWQNLESSDRIEAIAHWRMHLLIESHVGEAVHRSNTSASKGR